MTGAVDETAKLLNCSTTKIRKAVSALNLREVFEDTELGRVIAHLSGLEYKTLRGLIRQGVAAKLLRPMYKLTPYSYRVVKAAVDYADSANITD
ncbi:TPA: hypothetical protein ACX6R8_003769 [Photobacterium damselae]